LAGSLLDSSNFKQAAAYNASGVQVEEECYIVALSQRASICDTVKFVRPRELSDDLRGNIFGSVIGRRYGSGKSSVCY
jgi:hypothetical protein